MAPRVMGQFDDERPHVARFEDFSGEGGSAAAAERPPGKLSERRVAPRVLSRQRSEDVQGRKRFMSASEAGLPKQTEPPPALTGNCNLRRFGVCPVPVFLKN